LSPVTGSSASRKRQKQLRAQVDEAEAVVAGALVRAGAEHHAHHVDPLGLEVIARGTAPAAGEVDVDLAAIAHVLDHQRGDGRPVGGVHALALDQLLEAVAVERRQHGLVAPALGDVDAELRDVPIAALSSRSKDPLCAVKQTSWR
jgi:hypothetical protein